METTQKGFTLLEIILVIIIGSIISAMFIPFMMTSLMRSSESVQIVNESLHINAVLADLTSDYRRQQRAGTLDLQDFYNNLSTFQQNDVTVSGKFIDFRNGSGDLNDSDSDGIYDPLESANNGTTLTSTLMVIAEKNNQSIRALFTD